MVHKGHWMNFVDGDVLIGPQERHPSYKIFSVVYSEPKKTRTFYFYDNFGKCWPILIILSFLRSKINADEAGIQPTASPWICCRTTLRNLSVQLYVLRSCLILLAHDAMQARPMPSCVVHLSVRLSVTFVNSVKPNKYIFKNFFTVG